MAQIGTMTTGAGVVTSLNLPYCPQYIVIDTTYSGTFDLTNPNPDFQSVLEHRGYEFNSRGQAIKSEVK